MSKTVTFTPAGATIETVNRLVAAQEMDALALYMAYVAIAEWQKNFSVYATTQFMMKRVGWGEKKVQKAKKVLTDMDLIRDIRRTDKQGKTEKWYVEIRHLVGEEENHPRQNGGGGENHPVTFPPSGKTTPVVFDPPSAFNRNKVRSIETEVLNTDEPKKQTFSAGGAEIIHAFLTNGINKTASQWYNRPPVRAACDRLIDQHGKDKVLQVVQFLEVTNQTEYFPVITTPQELEKKWATLESATRRKWKKRAEQASTADLGALSRQKLAEQQS